MVEPARGARKTEKFFRHDSGRVLPHPITDGTGHAMNPAETFLQMLTGGTAVMDTQYPTEGTWRAWPLSWSGVWVGALAALALGLIIGLIGYAVGAHEMSTRIVRWNTVKLLSISFSIAGAFFSFVLGGWAAARVAGIRRAEPAMLHGVIAFLVTVPMLLMLASFGATARYGGWYAGLGGTPAWVSATVAAAADPDAAAAARNAALTSVAALLLGLVGSVLGGWMASGEPMSLTYYRRRDQERYERPRRAA